MVQIQSARFDVRVFLQNYSDFGKYLIQFLKNWTTPWVESKNEQILGLE